MGMSALQILVPSSLLCRTAWSWSPPSVCLFSFDFAVVCIQLQWSPALKRWKHWQKVNRGTIDFNSLFFIKVLLLLAGGPSFLLLQTFPE